MSAYSANRVHRASELPGEAGRMARALASFVRAAVAAAVLAHERRIACRHLQAMSDHQLNDIGVNRAEIQARVYGRSS